jgi:hypothetical protein
MSVCVPKLLPAIVRGIILNPVLTWTKSTATMRGKTNPNSRDMFTIEGTGEIIAMQGLQFFIIVKGKKNLTMNRLF